MTLRIWVAFYLRALANWLAPEDHLDIILRVARDAAQVRARALVEAADASAPGTSGEWKRHVVLAQMQKDFPRLQEREIALHIEGAVRER